jgi:hypothetical protein
MKKVILGGIAVVVIAVMAAVNVSLGSQSENLLSDLALANVEALAQNEDGYGCGGNVTFVKDESLQSKTCIIFISHRYTCQSKANVCCDPSKQTSCSGTI